MQNQMTVSSKRWSFTAWQEPTMKLQLVEYLVWQMELCPCTKTKHYQGYVEFKKEYTGKYVKSLFRDKTIHVEASRKGRDANDDYCTKSRTKIGEAFCYRNKEATIWDEFPIEST